MAYELHPICMEWPDLTPGEYRMMTHDMRERGLIQPVIIWRGLLVDGRHRMTICEHLNITLRTEDWSHLHEKEMIARVRSLNQHRRSCTTPLTNKEKRMRIDDELAKDPNRSDRAIAEAAGVNDTTVAARRQESEVQESCTSDSHRVGMNGYNSKTRAHVVAAIKADPHAPSKDIASKFGVPGKYVNRVRFELGLSRRRRKHAATTARPKRSTEPHGPKVQTPPGVSLADHIRAGMAMESRGLTFPQITEQLGMGGLSYRQGRAIVQLAERCDLAPMERALVAAAFESMNETSRTKRPYERVESLVKKIWGSKARDKKGEARRLEAFLKAITVLTQVCESANEIAIPHLEPAAVRQIMKQLKEAGRNMTRLRNRIKGLPVAELHNDHDETQTDGAST